MSVSENKTVAAVARGVIGKTAKEAETIITEAGFQSRAIMIDGVGIPGLTDASTTRVKLWLENGVVTDTRVG